MAMALTVWLLLLSSLFLLPIFVLAQTNGSVAVGASLSAAGNSSWISPSGDFAFGFRQLENNDLFLLSIWFAKIPDRTIVWYANGDKPAPKGSTVNLTANSGLVLTSPQGDELWKSNQIIAGVVAHGVMNDKGNFVLEDNKSAKLWETFNNPTDTMLPGQIMERGGKLSSRNSETDYSRGRFQLDFQEDGNLVLSAKKPFYSTETTTGTVPGSEGLRLVFNDSGNFYILRVNGRHFIFTGDERASRDYYLRTTLSFDGVLAQYFLPKTSVGNASWAPLWSRPEKSELILILRYHTTPLTEKAPTPETPAPLPPMKGKKSNTKKIIIIIVVVISFVTMLLGGICIFFRVKQPRVKLEDDINSEEISFVESLQYDFENIRSATDDFSDENKLGEGGFGSVYKGTLFNGQYIAVKRLSKSSEQGDREFKNEVSLLAQLHHRNVVRLLGYCLKGEERLLIYEYIHNTSLNHFIFDPINHGHLDWKTRYKIIGGIVRGLLYLHEDSQLRIVHRDLKASNILLGEDMKPKIADFGMARLFAMDQTQGDTKTIVGTYGYMAPEYKNHGRFSVKSDVFSFGVLVLEIISGKKIGNFRNGENEEDLLSYAWRNWMDDTIPNIIDPMLTTGSRNETIRCIHIGLLCVQENVNDRPTMASVVSMLNSHSLTLSVPSRPAYYSQYNSESSDASFRLTETSDKSNSSVYVSRNVVSNITEPYPR